MFVTNPLFYNWRRKWLGWIAIGLAVAAMIGWSQVDLARNPAWLIGWGGVGFAAMGLQFLSHRRNPSRCIARIILVSALLRLIGVLIEPSLSTDIYRYAWDGEVALSGANPYLTTPESPELEPLRSPLWQGIDHRDVPTVYPPLALASFMVAATGPIPLLTLKILFGLTDLVTVWLLIGILKRRAIDPIWAVLYGWNPLVVLETAGMGHVDSLGVMLITLAVVVVDRRRPRAAGFAIAGAVLTKAVPIVVLPLLSRGRWWVSAAARTRFLAVAVACLVMVAVVWFWLLGGIPPGWLQFGISWEFNGPIFEPLWRALEIVSAPEAIATVLDRLKDWTGEHDFWNRFYPFLYPQLVAKGFLAVGLGLWLIWSWRAITLEGGLRQVFTGLIIFSATVYPWYLLWVLPWAVTTRRCSYIALSGLALVSYLPQIYGQSVFPGYRALMWGGFGFAWLVENRWRGNLE